MREVTHPDLNIPPLDTLEPPPPKKKFSRGIRPDHIACGEVLALYESPSPESGYQPVEKLSQSEAKVEPNDVFPTLIGLQKNSITYIFGCCRQRGSKTSGPVTISSLCISLNSTKSAVRKAFQRLEQKQCLLRTFFKAGRGGWSEYSIPNTVYSFLLYEESRAKAEPKLSHS